MHLARRFDLTHVGFEGKARQGPANRPRPPRLPVPHSRLAAQRSRAGECRARAFPRWVLAQAGLDPSSYSGAPLERRISACLRALRAPSESAARQLLTARPALLSVAVSALLIGVTEFFRDQFVFDDLRAKALPALERSPGTLRVWSAGCSSGAELYSVAMLLADAKLLERSELLGTDCRPDAIAEAEAGLYPQAVVAMLPASVRERHFQPFETGWRPNELLRRATRWKAADLLKEVEPGPWDLILCRNVLIYVSAETAPGIVDRLTAEARPGGHLVLGKAEVANPSSPLVRVARCLYRKR